MEGDGFEFVYYRFGKGLGEDGLGTLIGSVLGSGALGLAVPIALRFMDLAHILPGIETNGMVEFFDNDEMNYMFVSMISSTVGGGIVGQTTRTAIDKTLKRVNRDKYEGFISRRYSPQKTLEAINDLYRSVPVERLKDIVTELKEVGAAHDRQLTPYELIDLVKINLTELRENQSVDETLARLQSDGTHQTERSPTPNQRALGQRQKQRSLR